MKRQKPLNQTKNLSHHSPASIRIRKMISFWSHTPETEGALSDVEGCMLSVGLGEAPLSASNIYHLGKFTEFGIVFKKCALDALRKAYQKLL